jgi:hypothetical protein
MTDAPHMQHGRSLIARILDALRGRRKDDRVLVLVNTTQGIKTVPVPADALR